MSRLHQGRKATLVVDLCPPAQRLRRAASADGAARVDYGVVCTISTSVFDRRATLAGTEPSSRPAMVLSPTLPTTSRSALDSSASSTRASTGAPTTAFSSTSVAPAA